MVMHRLLGIGLLLPLAVSAQEIDPLAFWPFEVGNVWEYEWETGGSYIDTSWTSATGYERWTVLEATTLAGKPAYGLNVSRYSDTNPPPDPPLSVNCVVATSRWENPPNLGIEIIADGGRCPDFRLNGYVNSVAFWHQNPPEGPVVVGGVPYAIEALASGWQDDCGVGGLGCWQLTWEHALGLGVFEHRWSHCADYSCEYERYTLGYAIVGGQVYGQWPVASELPGAAPAAYRIESAYPNPFRAQTALSFHLAETDRVALQVYDLRGRLVQSADLGVLGAGGHRVSVEGTGLAPGLYLVRLATDEGASVTRRIVRAR